MSCDSYAVYVVGVKFSLKSTITKTKNPLYGKYKFDPETGKKIEEFIENTDVKDLINNFILKYNYNSFTVYDENQTEFFGSMTTVYTDTQKYEKLNYIDSLPKNYQEFIDLLKTHNIQYEEGRFLISSLSC